MSVTELARLVYRDYVPMKHASRKRLASELQSIEASAPRLPRQRLALDDDAENAGTVLLSKLLLRYLMEVP